MISVAAHELAHASHFSNVGSWYWSQYIAYIMTYGGYGDASKKNASICGVGEMWGYYVGGLLATEQYEGTHFNGDDWFRPEILRQLGHNRNVRLTHLTNPLSEKQIFDCLTSDIRSHEQLKNRLISRYGRATEIRAVFEAFGF
ncbi:hypothetical protein [Alkalitalea saponilacus]|uniref:hypothetical protein n=1 Tax=Alkalitalea saponilacus TaxID=889453 RepID=UPI0012FAEA81|nr:hypothetical protein [Alkalitalea saponilacus]